MCSSQISLEIINGSPQKTYDNKVYFERFLYLCLCLFVFYICFCPFACISRKNHLNTIMT